jgi:hypothetical protein
MRWCAGALVVVSRETRIFGRGKSLQSTHHPIDGIHGSCSHAGMEPPTDLGLVWTGPQPFLVSSFFPSSFFVSPASDPENAYIIIFFFTSSTAQVGRMDGSALHLAYTCIAYQSRLMTRSSCRASLVW